MIRVGIGQDSHSFEKKTRKPLVLGGVVVPDEQGLEGNSDGDVILHALCNALSSAVGGDSLSTWSDEMCLRQGIKDSSAYVQHIFESVRRKGYRVENVSVSIEAKKPRVALPIIQEMKQTIARFLLIQHDQVGITFTSGEGLTSFGKGDGMQAFVAVGLYKES